MQKPLAALIRLAAASCLLGMPASAGAAPLSPEDRYIAARDAAIAKITKMYDDKKADEAADDLQSNRIDRKAHDKLGDIRQQGEDAYKKCFTQRAPLQPSFAEATKQALLAEAMEE